MLQLVALVGDGEVRCERIDVQSYGRDLALCAAGGRDLSLAMIQSGHAVRGAPTCAGSGQTCCPCSARRSAKHKRRASACGRRSEPFRGVAGLALQ